MNSLLLVGTICSAKVSALSLTLKRRLPTGRIT
jgi:hypothetical protein